MSELARVSAIRSLWPIDAIAAMAIVVTACAPVPQVQVNTKDTTRPELTLTSANLLPDLGTGASTPQSNPVTPSEIESVTTFPETLGFDDALANPEALVAVKASDPESGVRGVEITGQATAWCNSGWRATTPARQVSLTLPSVVTGDISPANGPTASQPAERLVSMPIRHAALRAACGADVLTDFEVVLQVSARNGADLQNRSTVRIVRPVSVVVHNMWGPCLIQLAAQGDRNLNGATLCDGLHNQRPGVGPGQLTHLNEQLDRWGRYFATQDIVILNEGTNPAWIQRIALSAPNHSLAYRNTVAILSRWPLDNISDRKTADICVTDADGTFVCGLASEYVRANVLTPRGSMDAVSVHWQHRPVPVTSHPSRVAFAQQIVQDILPSRWAVVGGDFNSKSVWIASPDELAGSSPSETTRTRNAFNSLGGRSMPEVQAIENVMTNARREVWETDRTHWSHSFPWPVDHVFTRNNLNAVLYTNDRTSMFGSDHPTLKVILLRR